MPATRGNKPDARTGFLNAAGLNGKLIGEHFVLVHIGGAKKLAVRPGDKAVVFRGAKPGRV